MNNTFPDMSSVATNVLLRKGIGIDDAYAIGADMGEAVAVEYWYDGAFTTAVISNSHGIIGAGSSKRNQRDHVSPIRGRALALSRALSAYFNICAYKVDRIRSNLYE